MKIQLSKLSALCQAFSLLSFGVLLSSCQLPKEQDDRYSVAEWSVNSTVAKEDYPVGVSLEQVDEAPLPSLEEIASGLPGYEGSGQAIPDPNLLPVEEAIVAEPHLASLGSEFPVSDELLGSSSELELPPPAPEVAATEPEILPALEEVRTAEINPSPENLALMAASTTRPPMAPRGVNGKPIYNIAEAYAAPTEQVAAIAPAQVTPSLDDLSEILDLARQVEASHR